MPAFTYDRFGSFRGWLRTIMHNKFHEHKTRKGLRRSPAGAADLEGLASPDNVQDWSEEEFRRHVTMQAMQLMQAEFQPTTWKACWEHVVGDRPAADVARELGITVNAVYLAKSRVLRRLRQELEGMLE
jgi:RNA polymerase sigma-70 factor (ECF subfamily)